jgi:hypothetical protein
MTVNCVFKIEIFPDKDQRKEIKRVSEAVGKIRSKLIHELVRQYNCMGMFYSESEALVWALEMSVEVNIGAFEIVHVVRESYSHFMKIVDLSRGKSIKRRPRPTFPFIEIPAAIFDYENRMVSIPHIGKVRYRPNPKCDPESKKGRVFLGSQGATSYILVDFREKQPIINKIKIRLRPTRNLDMIISDGSTIASSSKFRSGEPNGSV